MQSIRSAILGYVRIGTTRRQWLCAEDGNALSRLRHHTYASSCTSSDQLMARVIGLVKKFDKIESNKVTETADFQKDLSLDSLDRVELVMAFEEEFSIEIPDEEADKLTCCVDVAKYIASRTKQNIAESS
ncbi:acyl carrier protein 3, mitochondrial [Macadamia integrifolia]|uniref:acyl carrier protein 3, mitochondrial n=1 Tax=Macadamia integrifolia TaxID=60698 RepID=UPI001C4F0096|nr:acyl carrier protein 3, mitochondrial [Macadamia integrifolia]XP_042520237.1 acyl carrier protein 3, mitochondrial [Macadamia integrifolia]